MTPKRKESRNKSAPRGGGYAVRRDDHATTVDTTSAGAGPASHRPDVAETQDGGRGPDRAPDATRAAIEAAAGLSGDYAAHMHRHRCLIAKSDAAEARGSREMASVYLTSACDALNAALSALRD